MSYTPQASTPLSPLPEGSWDTHFHVFPPGAKPGPNAPWRPPVIPHEAIEEYHAALGIPNSVLAHSFSFGTDQSSLEAYVAKSSPEGLRRGIGAEPVELAQGGEAATLAVKRAHDEGIRGIRAVPGAKDAKARAEQIEQLCVALDAAGAKGWSVCLQDQDPSLFDHLLERIDRIPTSNILMIDHMGFLPGPWSRPSPTLKSIEEVENLPHVSAVLELLKRPNVYTKLSAPYRLTSDNATLEPLVKAIAKVASDRVIWASDWPFVPLHKDWPADRGETIKLRNEDMPRWLELLREWLGEEVFGDMMVKNPQRIYG